MKPSTDDWILSSLKHRERWPYVAPAILAVVLCAAAALVRVLLIPLIDEGFWFITYFPALVAASLLSGPVAASLVLAGSVAITAATFVVWPAGGPALIPILAYLSAGALVVAATTVARGLLQRARATETLLYQVLQAADMATWQDGPSLPTPVWSAEFRELVGVDPEAPASADLLLTVVHPSDRKSVADFLARLRNGDRQDLDIEFRTKGRSGQETWFQIRGRYLDAARSIAVGSIRDISSRKRNQLQLELINSELRHRLKNVFAMAGAIAAQTIKEGGSPESITLKINDRIRALAAAQDLLLRRCRPAPVSAIWPRRSCVPWCPRPAVSSKQVPTSCCRAMQ